MPISSSVSCIVESFGVRDEESTVTRELVVVELFIRHGLSP